MIIGWFSGGVTSAMSIHLAIELYGKENVRPIFIDTQNEHPDTYRFMLDCENWYGKKIETITGLGDKYKSIQDVWIKRKSLNVAKGAICSSTLKTEVRRKWEKNNTWTHQVFGFDISEPKRAESLKLNHSYTKPIFPLLMYGMSKEDCIEHIQSIGIDLPKAYLMGFRNNNCLKTGCVQGGIGYWQKMRDDLPDNFNKMADMEHYLTNIKGKPVTMLSNRIKGNKEPLFLKPHPDYPNLPHIGMKKRTEVKPLIECNGFCGVNDLEKPNETQDDINYDNQIKLF